MLARLKTLHPFQTPEARRLAFLFAIVYFAQGMWYLPNQTLTIVLKERGLSAGQVATFFTISTLPWRIKPPLRPRLRLRPLVRASAEELSAPHLGRGSRGGLRPCRRGAGATTRRQALIR